VLGSGNSHGNVLDLPVEDLLRVEQKAVNPTPTINQSTDGAWTKPSGGEE
jgi:hypothetical protein